MVVFYILERCCGAINDRLQNMFIELPNYLRNWLEISKKFEQRWNYPHDLCVIDRKHVQIVKDLTKGYNRGYFLPLQTPRSEHKVKGSAKAIRDKFKDYFITNDALEWQ